VLIAEHPKGDKNNFVREYVAAVKLVKRLPEEYDSLLNKHKEETEEGKLKYPLFDEHDDAPEKAGARVRRMLREDPREAERVARFYTDMANDGNAASQFELANFYLEGIGVKQDDAKAMEWLQKAAQQGHHTAIEFLRVIEKNK
jgi:TPR repeat protein